MSQDHEPRYVESVRASDGRLLSAETFVVGPLSRFDGVVSGAALFLGVVGAVRAREIVAPEAMLAPFLVIALVAWASFGAAQWFAARRRWRDEGVPAEWFRASPAGIATLLQLLVLTLTSLALVVTALQA